MPVAMFEAKRRRSASMASTSLSESKIASSESDDEEEAAVPALTVAKMERSGMMILRKSMLICEELGVRR
jgi:hypothetical protein